MAQNPIFPNDEIDIINKITDKTYLNLIRSDPENASNWFILGNVHYFQKDFEIAEKCYRKCVSLDPKNAEAWNNLGSLLNEIHQNYEEAEQCLKEAVTLDPKYSEAWYHLGKMVVQLPNREADALHYLQQAITHFSDEKNDFSDLLIFESWLFSGMLYSDSKKDVINAEICYRTALEYNPDSDYTWYLLGCLFLYSNPEEAERCFNQCIEINPHNAEAWNDLGYLYHTVKHDLGQAEACYHEAVENNPDNANHWYNCACIEAIHHHKETMMEYLSHAIELNEEKKDKVLQDPDFREYWQEIKENF